MTQPWAPVATAGDSDEEYRFPVSYPQLRLWFENRLAPGDPAYHMPIALRLRGDLNVPALDRALQRIVDRHEVLRTGFAAEDGEPVQVVRARLATVLTVADLSAVADPQRRLREMAGGVIRHPFDLTRAPLLRAVLARLGPTEHVLIVAVHHVACDGWSIGVMAAELSELYRATVAGREPRLPELPVQYGDFAVWQRQYLSGPTLEAVLAHWVRVLEGAPGALDLPTDHPRVLVATNRGARLRRTLGPDLAESVERLAPARGVSLFMVLLAGYAAVLSRLAGVPDVVIGTPTAGRPRPEVQGLIGCFIDMLPVRVDTSGDPTAAELLDRARTMSLAALAHQALPFERLVEHLRPDRDLPRTPVFQVMLSLQDTPAPVIDLPGVSVEPVQLPRTAARYELTLDVERAGDDLVLDLEYNRDLFTDATAEGILDRVVAALEWLSGPGETPLSAALADPPGGPLADPPGGQPGDVLRIRGYRVDPADLVTVIARHPAVEECAVVVRDGTPTGYVVPRRQPPVDPRRLAERLRADLPSYLVPATIVPVERLPRAADGTVDRAALPQPAAEPSRPSSAQPRDEREATVLDCFRRVLGRPSLGMTDGFFDNGGSSRMALRLVAEIERDLGCQVRLRALFQAPTPRGVAAALSEDPPDGTDRPDGAAGGPAGAAAGPVQDSRLPADIEPAPAHPQAWHPGRVLLTGATGFLGQILLQRLLQVPGTVVTCLVRAGDDDTAAARLRQAAARYGYQPVFDSRVRAVAGDLTAPNLGLDTAGYAALAREVAAVYHCGAEVSFAAPYEALRATNVTGTVEVIRFAATATGKALHYVSTLGQEAAGPALREQLYPAEATEATSSGYATSKRVAEALVAEAGGRGLPVTILRPGLVTADRSSGAMGQHDQLALGLEAALRLRILPDLPDLPIHIMPADEVADAILHLGQCPDAAGRVVHLYNPRLARLGDVATLLAQLGHACRPVPPARWADTVAASDAPADYRLLVRLFAEAPQRAARGPQLARTAVASQLYREARGPQLARTAVASQLHRGASTVETRAAAALLGHPLVFSELTAAYLQRAIGYLLTRTGSGGPS